MESDKRKACDSSMSRAQFIKALVERAMLAGTLVVVPAVADSFAKPPKSGGVSGKKGLGIGRGP